MKYCEGVQILIAQYLVTRDHRAHFKMVGLKNMAKTNKNPFKRVTVPQFIMHSHTLKIKPSKSGHRAKALPLPLSLSVVRRPGMSCNH